MFKVILKSLFRSKKDLLLFIMIVLIMIVAGFTLFSVPASTLAVGGIIT